MNHNTNSINRSVQERQAIHMWTLTAEPDTTQPHPHHPNLEGTSSPVPRKWCEVAQNFSTREQAAVVQTREMLKRPVQTHRHSLCISMSDSSHTLFWLLQKLTLSWLEPGHYPSLILHYIHHVQIRLLFNYTHTYIYTHTQTPVSTQAQVLFPLLMAVPLRCLLRLFSPRLWIPSILEVFLGQEGWLQTASGVYDWCIWNSVYTLSRAVTAQSGTAIQQPIQFNITDSSNRKSHPFEIHIMFPCPSTLPTKSTQVLEQTQSHR